MPMEHGAWTRMKQLWTRWPKRCCTSPKKKDCSQPRDASPYLRGSTSSSRRSRCEASVPAHQRGNASALNHTLPLVKALSLVQCKRQELLPEQCDLSSRPAWFDETVEEDCFIVCVALASIFVTSDTKIKFLDLLLPTPSPHHRLPRATMCVFAITTGHMFWVRTLKLCDYITFLPTFLHFLTKL